MLPHAQRLNVRDFAVAFKQGGVLRHPLLQLRVYRRENIIDSQSAAKAESTSEISTRAAFVAPKKIGNAVVRNRIRRRVRERYRRLQTGALSTPLSNCELNNCDLLFMVTSECRTASELQIDAALAQLLKRAGKHVALD